MGSVISEKILSEARQYAITESERFGTPLPVHFEITEHKAVELAQQFGADVGIAKLGVYLMDLKLGEALTAGRLNEHIPMSKAAALEFLKPYGLTFEVEAKVVNCIEEHHGAVQFASKESEICANADAYRFIHPRGFFAYLTLLGKRTADYKEILNQLEHKIDEKHSVISLEICKQELEPFYFGFKEYLESARRI